MMSRPLGCSKDKTSETIVADMEIEKVKVNSIIEEIAVIEQ